MKDYNNIIDELIREAKNFPDNECWNSSSKNEIKYIKEKAPRIKATIQFFSSLMQENNSNNLKILDIGTSPFTFLYQKYFGSEVASIDINNFFEKRCMSNNIEFKKCNLLKEDILFPDNEFDIIIFTEVFEHLMGPPQTIFSRIRKVLKKDGVLVFSTPNISSYYLIAKLLRGKTIFTPVDLLYRKNERGEWVNEGYGHWRKFAMGELIDVLFRNGFKVITHKNIMKPYLDIKTKNPFKFARRLLWNLFVSIMPPTIFNLILAKKD